MEALKSIAAGYKKNWVPALLGAIGGYFIVKKAIKANSLWAIGAGILVGSAVGSTISVKSTPKVVSTSSAPVTKP